MLQHRHKLYDTLAQKWELDKDQFPVSFQPDLKERVYFFGHAELGTEVTQGELLFAVNHEILSHLLSIMTVVTEQPRAQFVGKDFEKLFKLHHARVVFLLDILVDKQVLAKQVTTIKDSLGKLSPDVTLFSLNPVINKEDLKHVLSALQEAPERIFNLE